MPLERVPCYKSCYIGCCPYLNGEVNVSRSVNNVDVVILPHHESGRGLNGDASLSFELHGVHCGSDAIFSFDLVNLFDSSRVEQDSFCQSGFPRINMRRDTDISHTPKINNAIGLKANALVAYEILGTKKMSKATSTVHDGQWCED